ncbi:MAG TPA: DUF721 domain-containing protein [Gammaproteobacteria bacterium]
MSKSRTVASLFSDPNGPYGKLIERSRLYHTLHTRLESVLGQEIASHYRIQNLREGLLLLQADAPSWASRLRFELPRLLDQLRASPELRLLRDIRVRVVPPEVPRAPRVRRAKLSSKAASVLEGAADATEDPQLRDALRRLARRGKN